MKKVIGLNGRGARYEFTEEEDKYLIEHYATGTNVDIADHFGISYPVVARRAKELGLKKASNSERPRYQYRYVRDYKHGWYKNFKSL